MIPVVITTLSTDENDINKIIAGEIAKMSSYILTDMQVTPVAGKLLILLKFNDVLKAIDPLLSGANLKHRNLNGGTATQYPATPVTTPQPIIPKITSVYSKGIFSTDQWVERANNMRNINNIIGA